MADIFAILIGVFSIAVLAFGVGYFNTRMHTADKKLRKLRKDREKILKPLMSSSELSQYAVRLIKLREKARRVRNPSSPHCCPNGDCRGDCS